MFDLKITGGTLVDGTGRPRYVGDVAIQDGRIVAIAEKVEGAAREEIDARGLLVTPGFVDIHTHYDGQATWDPVLDPSASHGVTTVVTGNCGVGFAPVRPGETLEVPRSVDDLPAGGRRILQDAHGYVATIVNGVVTRRHDRDTGARPGRLVRVSHTPQIR